MRPASARCSRPWRRRPRLIGSWSRRHASNPSTAGPSTRQHLADLRLGVVVEKELAADLELVLLARGARHRLLEEAAGDAAQDVLADRTEQVPLVDELVIEGAAGESRPA